MSFAYLGQLVLARKARATIALHETTVRARAVTTSGAAHADIAAAFLEDDAKDDALVNTNISSSLLNCNSDTTNIVKAGAGIDHRLLVGVEDVAPLQPGAHRREVLPWTTVLAALPGVKSLVASLEWGGKCHRQRGSQRKENGALE